MPESRPVRIVCGNKAGDKRLDFIYPNGETATVTGLFGLIRQCWKIVRNGATVRLIDGKTNRLIDG